MVDENNDRDPRSWLGYSRILKESVGDAILYGVDTKHELATIKMKDGRMVDVRWENATSLIGNDGKHVFPESKGWSYNDDVVETIAPGRHGGDRSVGWLARGANGSSTLDKGATTRVFFHGTGNSYVNFTPEYENINLFRTTFLTSAPANQNVVGINLQRSDTYGIQARDAQLRALVLEMKGRGLTKLEVIGESLGGIEAARFAAIAKEEGLDIQSVTMVAAPNNFERATMNYLGLANSKIRAGALSRAMGPDDKHSAIDSLTALKDAGYTGPVNIVRTMLEAEGRPDSYVFQKDQQAVVDHATRLFGDKAKVTEAAVTHTNYDYRVLQTMIQNPDLVKPAEALAMDKANTAVVDAMKTKSAPQR
ncbi:MAG: hypothetical protein MRY32_03730 [Rickettsiales bacterium]|nr:hypothetical protein [Rickettsiales bacterium]